ncbi:MAG TPA: efflux transporter periplasmic adaptor subunit, partial [Gallionella sp.]
TPKNVVETRQVEVGPVSGTQTVINAGLAEGERVVVEGQFQLEEGARVDVKAAPQAEATQADAAGRS